MKRILIALSFGILLCVLYAFAFLPRMENMLSSNKPTLTDTTAEVDWHIPAIPTELTWEESVLPEDDFYNYHMFYDNRYAPNPRVYKDGSVPTAGKLYEAKITDKDALFNSDFSSLTLYALKLLEGTPWQQFQQYGDYNVAGMAADGTTGSILGFVNIQGDQARTVVYSQSISGTLVSNEQEPPHTNCPCTKTLRIFVGDPVDLRQYIQ